MIKNLLKETIDELNTYGKVGDDVLWVGRVCWIGIGDCKAYYTTWEDFCSKADFEYDSGYGEPEIPMDLIVVGKDFWLERCEYDGSEWWEFKTMPIKPKETRELVLK